MRKNLILFMLLCILVALPSVPIGETALEKVVLDERIIQDPMKSWSITFTDAVNKGTIKKQNFYLADAKQRKVKAKLRLSDDGRKVTITPVAPYKEGVQYYLYIKGNVKSGTNVYLNEHTILPFKLDRSSKDEETDKKKPGSANNKPASGSGSSGNDSGNSNSDSDSGGSSNSNVDKDNKNILKAEAQRHPHFVEISVQVSESVVKVKAGRDEFEYKGNNMFSLYKPGLKSGEKLVIQGFSISNKVLGTKEIVIP